MNTLTEAQRERVLALLRAGKSLRQIEHETGHRRETIAAYGRRAGVITETKRGDAPQVNAAFARTALTRHIGQTRHARGQTPARSGLQRR